MISRMLDVAQEVIFTRSSSEVRVCRFMRHSTDGLGKPLKAQAMVAVVPYRRSRSEGSIVNLGAAVQGGNISSMQASKCDMLHFSMIMLTLL